MRGVDHRHVVVVAQEQRAAAHEVVGGEHDRRLRVGQPVLAEVPPQRGQQAVGLVALVDQPADGGDELDQRAVEDLRPLVEVDARDPLGRQRLRLRQRAGDDGARRGPGHEVEQLARGAAAAPLDLLEHARRDQPADAAAVDRQHLHGTRSSAASASATTRRTISAAGRTSWMRPADWPANGRYSSPRPASRASRIRAPVVRRVEPLRVLAQLLDQRRGQRARLDPAPGPRVGRHHALAVDDLDGVRRVGLDDAALPLLGDAELGRGQEPRAHAHALRAEHQRRGQPAPVGDAAGRDHGDVAGQRRRPAARAPSSTPSRSGRRPRRPGR